MIDCLRLSFISTKFEYNLQLIVIGGPIRCAFNDSSDVGAHIRQSHVDQRARDLASELRLHSILNDPTLPFSIRTQICFTVCLIPFFSFPAHSLFQ
jgi:hypothetical protein